MPPYKLKLRALKGLCRGTAAFYFEKPAAFEFEAGQFANFTLLDAASPDPQGNTRTFSIASAPHENHLMVAMRMRPTGFKTALASLPLNSEILLQGPFGSLTLPRNGTRPVALLAGGIGVTPFRSLVWKAAEALSPRRVLLFYSVRVPEEAPFLDELREMERFNGRYKLVCSITRPEKTKTQWHGETGRVSIELLSKWIPDLKVPLYFVAGPAGMVTSVRRMLVDAGISEEDIRAEEFYGYD